MSPPAPELAGAGSGATPADVCGGAKRGATGAGTAPGMLWLRCGTVKVSVLQKAAGGWSEVNLSEINKDLPAAARLDV